MRRQRLTWPSPWRVPRFRSSSICPLKSGVISRPSPLLSTAASGREPPQSREELTNRRRREGESVGAFTADIRVYARRGYPTFPAAAREELSLHAFLRGLTPERLRQHVRLLSPRDLSEALREAERAEEVLQAGPMTGRSPLQRQLTRAAEREVDGVQPEEEEVSRVQPAVTPRRRSRLDRCFRCGEPGHFARDCPAPSPRPRAMSPPGNDLGVRQ